GRVGSLTAVLEEPQRGQNAFGRVLTLEPAVVHRDRVTTQSQPRGRNAARRILAGVVGHKSITGIRVVQKIAKCQLLKLEDIVGQFGHANNSPSSLPMYFSYSAYKRTVAWSSQNPTNEEAV